MFVDEEISLLFLTEHMQVDSALYGFTGLCHLAFPGRLRALYLLGSHASGEAVVDSDIDVTLVFKERFQEGEQERFERFRHYLGPLLSLPLDPSAVEEAQLLEEGAVNLKLSSQLLMGEDLRERVPLVPLERWVRSCMHRPYVFMERARARAEGEPLRYPLQYPDPRGELYGYDHRPVMDAQGNIHPGFKELVTLAGWLAAVEVALEAGQHVTSKEGAFQAHRRHVNNSRSALYEQIYACRKRWSYRVPERPEDRAHLRSLCAAMLEAENGFLERYKGYLLAELRQGREKDRVQAARRLGEILYPGEEVPAALRPLESAPEQALREAARESLERLERYGTAR
jgi:predicted nucleotidyltransferase